MVSTRDAHGPVTSSSEALFRYLVVSQVLARELRGEKRAAAVRAVAGETHVTVAGGPRRVSVRTVYRWLSAFEREGFGGLEPKSRELVAASAVLPAALIEFLRAEKTSDPRASAPELIRRAREQDIIAATDAVSRTTVWRVLRRLGLPMQRRPSKHEGDMRRFAYPNRMLMVLADGKHFRAGATRKRRVALFFIDDATRKGLQVVVGTHECTELFLRGLYELIRRAGFMVVIYLDNGPGFISDDTIAVIAQLPGVHLVHGTSGYPEGHGKIERFNREAIAGVLRALDGAADVDPAGRALELRLGHYLDHQYNLKEHEALAGQTPAERWAADERQLRFPDDDEQLRDYFVVTETRHASKDHVIKYGGGEYEVPRGLGGSVVTVHRQVLDQELYLVHDGRIVGLQPVDREANARSRRSRPAPAETSVSGEAVPRTAATIAYDKEFGAVVAPDGGFVPPTNQED